MGMSVAHLKTTSIAAQFRAAMTIDTLRSDVEGIGFEFDPVNYNRYLAHPLREWYNKAISVQLLCNHSKLASDEGPTWRSPLAVQSL